MTHLTIARGIVVVVFTFFATGAFAAPPTFKGEEIDKSLKIGYAVSLVDINADGKPDIVVTDKDRVIWFENPTWKLRTILQGQTALDNVCLDAHDIDGDGQVDLALGAGWQPGKTNQPSTLQWLRRGKTLDEPWQMFPIKYDEPTLHRMRWADLGGGKKGDGKKVLVTVPLTGRGSTAGKNWSEAGVKVQAYAVPADPTKAEWPSELITDAFHVPHNFQVIESGPAAKILVASYEGVTLLSKSGDGWTPTKLGEGDQSNPAKNRGSSEIKQGKLKGGVDFIATIEPWHGNQVVVYVRAAGEKEWKRQVIDSDLQWGHAVSCADLDGDGSDELVVGVRDPLAGKAKPGVRVYVAGEGGAKWEKSELDPGGVAVEDLVVGDLDGDGRADIVAVGRASKNVKVYWNGK